MTKKRIERIKSAFFPSERQLMLRKWHADGGDYELRFDYVLDKRSVVLDLGGYQGQWTSDIFSRYRCQIYIFEPVIKFAELIRKRFCNNDQIEIFSYGLGGSSRSDKIYLAADSSSIFGTSENCQDIEIVDVKDWINQREIDKIELMKINIEGGEYELLDRMIETNLIEKIENIQVQFHNVSQNSQSRMQRIQEEMRKTHRPTYQYEFIWENWTLKRKRG